MMGRVTIACDSVCGSDATTVNRYRDPDETFERVNVCCDRHAERERSWDSPALAYSVYAPLINPGTASEDNITSVEIAMDVLCRLWRAATSNTFEAAADRALLRAAGEAALGTRYERCGDCYCGQVDTIGAGTQECPACNGTGWVLVHMEAA